MDNQDIYKSNYNKYILPKYGSIRDVQRDLDLIHNNNCNNLYHKKEIIMIKFYSL